MRLAFGFVVLASVVLPSPALSQGTTQTTWLFNGSMEGWTPVNWTSWSITGSAFVGDPANDPQLTSPLLSRPESSIDYIKFRINNAGPTAGGRVYYSKDGGGMSETNSRAFTLPTGNHWTVVRLDNIPGWVWNGSGNIDRIRLDPVNNGCSPEPCADDISLDALLLRKDDTAPVISGDPTANPSGYTNTNSYTFTWTGASDGPDDGSNTGYGSGVSHYEVQRGSEGWVGNGQSTSVPWTAYQEGANLFQVRAVDMTGNVSTVRSVNYYYDSVAPSTPGIASSSHSCGVWSTDNTIAVSWSASSDATSGVAGYSWEWSTSPTTVPDATVDGAGTSTTSGALASGTWYFHVRALDNAGNVGVTAHSCAYLVDTTAPTNPTSVSSGSHTPSQWSQDTTVDVTWSGASDAHSGVSGYSWLWDTLPATVPDATAEGTGTATTSPVLADGNAHYAHVRVGDNAGNWASGAQHYGPFWIDTTPPTNPTVTSPSHTPSVSSCDNTIDVTWSGAMDATSGVAGYSWLWDTSPATVPDGTIEGTGSSTTSPAVADGSTHYFHLRTLDNAGHWATGVEHLGPFVIGASGPGPVVNLSSSTHTAGTWSNVTTVELSWTVPGEICGGIAGYSYEWSSAPDTEPDATIETTSSTATQADRPNGCGYFHVRAVDVAAMAGSTMHAGPYCIDTAEPGNPTSLSSSSHTPSQWSMDNTVDLAWSGASDAHSGVGGYSYVWDTSAGTLPDAIDEGSNTQTASPPLADGSSHYFHLRTRDQAGNWTSAALHLGPFWIDTNAPGIVTGLQSTSHVVGTWSNDPTIEVTWQAPSTVAKAGARTSTAVGYSLAWSGSATTDPDATVETTGLVATSPVQPDGQRYFHVRPIDAAGNTGPTAHLGSFPIDTTPPSANLFTPNGGEVWPANSTQTIQFFYFDGTSGVGTVTLRYSIDAGMTFQHIATSPFDPPLSFDWTVPNTPSNTALLNVLVSDNAGNISQDTSSGYFHITADPTGIGGNGLLPTAFALGLASPNPFKDLTTFRYSVPYASDVRIDILDVSGRLVRTLLSNEHVRPGVHAARWDGRDGTDAPVSTGVYLYRMIAGDVHVTRKVILVR